ncbi:hypothetical protein [Methylosinus sp. PW1]|nr:hypothetical protein [Methylosinus sp. PW1]
MLAEIGKFIEYGGLFIVGVVVFAIAAPIIDTIWRAITGKSFN